MRPFVLGVTGRHPEEMPTRVVLYYQREWKAIAILPL